MTMFSLKTMRLLTAATTLLLLTLFAATANAKVKKKYFSAVATPLSIVEKVNDTYQANHQPEVDAFWDEAVYFTGNMEAYKLTGNARYLEYSDKWARHNNWSGATEKDTSKWLYKEYGETEQHVLFGDWQTCFQTYLDLYATNPDPYKISRVREVMDYITESDATDYWWWADALYMVMPVMAKLYKLTGDTRYLDKMYANFLYTDSIMWDEESHLYYRDGKYVYPQHKTESGLKDFWARGDGWVMAAFAKVLADMPLDYEHRDLFVNRFTMMAHAVAACQQEDGYWTRSMLDAQQAEGPETSGTALITYGLLWGINSGILDAQTFKPVTDKAWKYLATVALQSDGTVGYVQPIGERAVKGQQLTAQATSNFGTGAFLLAACEKVRLDGAAGGVKSFSITVSNNQLTERQEVVSLSADSVFDLLDIPGGRQFVVYNEDGQQVAYQLTYDGRVLIEASVAPSASTTYTFETGWPADFVNVCYGRVYPERVDDIAWENDRCAYRCYGPALQQSGEDAYGIDVWVKNTPGLVVEQRYFLEEKAKPVIAQLRQTDPDAASEMERNTSYHYDHGNGLDCYKVGPTLGCGAPALMDGDNIIFPYCYGDYELLDNGPLRFTVRLTYNPEQTGADKEVVETRLVSLDKGSNFNKIIVGYDGLSAAADVASGVVIHEEDTEHIILGDDYVAYADPTDNPEEHDFQIYVGVIFSYGADEVKTVMYDTPSRGNAGHALCVKRDVAAGKQLTYYAGSSWSEYDCPSLEEWKKRIESFRNSLANPLEITY